MFVLIAGFGFGRIERIEDDTIWVRTYDQPVPQDQLMIGVRLTVFSTQGRPAFFGLHESRNGRESALS